MSEGWIKLYRKFNEWEWKKRPNTVALFLHILTSANHKDGNWQGTTVLRGQMVCGRKQLSYDTGLTEQQVRTSLNQLKSTREITIKTTSKFSIITITNWNKYQVDNQQIPNEQPASNQQVTTNKNDNNKKNEKNILGETPKTPKNWAVRPEDVNQQIWDDFIALRKAKKSVLTHTALVNIENQAMQAGMTLEEALEECCARGWQGFKANWMDHVKRKQNGKRDTHDELREFLEHAGH